MTSWIALSYINLFMQLVQLKPRYSRHLAPIPTYPLYRSIHLTMEIYFPKMDGKVFCKTIAQQSQHSNHFRPTSDGGDSTGFPIVFTPYSASSSSAAEAMTINRAGAGSCPLLNPINPLTPPTHPKLFKMFCGFNFRWLQFVSGSSCFFFFFSFPCRSAHQSMQ